MNVHRIPTKVGTGIRINEPSECATFQPYPSMHSCFMADFAKCAKEDEEKNQEIERKLCLLLSRKWLEQFS